jgi:hypothetical protein
MSQPLQIQLQNAKEWLDQETRPLFGPLTDKAASLLKEVKVRIDDTMQSSQKILENSEREMDKNNSKTYRFARNANKFAQNLTETVKAVTVPDNSTYERLHVFCGDLEKAVTASEQLRRGAYPYISPYFIFDRRRLDVSLKRLYDIVKELRVFLTTKYAKVKIMEDANSLVDRLLQTINETKKSQESRRITEERQGVLEQEIANTQDEIGQIQAGAELQELMKVNQRIEELRENVKNNLRYLQKPFFKLQSLARTGEVAVPLDEMNTISNYLSDPYFALATEENGYSVLKSILQRLNTTIGQNKLKLKQARIRKAQDQINNILNKGTLSLLQKDCTESLSQRKQLLASETITTLQNHLTLLQNQLGQLQKENELVSSRRKALQDEQAKLNDRLEYLEKELEKNIFQLTNKNAHITLFA